MTLSLTCKLMLGSLITMMMTAHAAEHVSTTISHSIHSIANSYRSSAEVLAASSDAEWYELKQDNLIYITLNNGRLVVMELNDRFAPQHANQIRRLAKAAYWDGVPVYRVQDNYVVQFGALDYATDTLMKPLPPDAVKLPAEFTIPAHSLQMMALEDMDAHADRVGFVNGYPAGIKGDQAFLVHCYGMVGAARDDAPDSSNATELYVMIGQPARHIDRQISVVGRVVHGIEQLSSLPRGTGAMGFFEAGGHPLDIQSIRLGSDLPKSAQLRFKALDTNSQSFAQFVNARRHMQGDWFAAPVSGGLGVCDVRQTIQVIEG